MGGVDLSEVMRQAIDNPISVKSAEVLLLAASFRRVGENDSMCCGRAKRSVLAIATVRISPAHG